jgi:hypothetical protein
MSRRPIRIHIQELVLHGVDPRDRHAIGDAVQNELRDALASRQLDLRDARAIDRLDAGTLRTQRGARMRGLGTQIGGALAGTLEGAKRR